MLDIRSTLARQRQIDVLSYATTLGLIAAVVLMGYALLSRVDMTRVLLLQDPLVRPLVIGFLLTLLLYMADQRRRLRADIVARDRALTLAHAELVESVERLSFAHHTAEVMAAFSGDDAVMRVLGDVAERFGAQAAALVGEDLTVFSDDPDIEEAATADILPVATQCVGARKPLSMAVTDTGSCVMAVPLRVRGRLQYVCALWRSEGRFDSAQLEGLVLVARIMELGMEGEHMLEEARSRMSGTAEALLRVVEAAGVCRPRHARRVARTADEVARKLGMEPLQRETLHIVALLHDIGMIVAPEEALDQGRPIAGVVGDTRRHPHEGAELAALCGFGDDVTRGIATHHERFDRHVTAGSGSLNPYARVIAVCEAWDDLTRRTGGGSLVSEGDAARRLEQGAGTLFDPLAVDALLSVVGRSRDDVGTAVATALACAIIRPRRQVPGWRNGRRGGLKNLCPKGRVGSNPTPGTSVHIGSRRGSAQQRLDDSARVRAAPSARTRSVTCRHAIRAQRSARRSAAGTPPPRRVCARTRRAHAASSSPCARRAVPPRSRPPPSASARRRVVRRRAGRTRWRGAAAATADHREQHLLLAAVVHLVDERARVRRPACTHVLGRARGRPCTSVTAIPRGGLRDLQHLPVVAPQRVGALHGRLLPYAEPVPSRFAESRADAGRPASGNIHCPGGGEQWSEPWYKSAIIYAIDVEKFADGNGDGIGDFIGPARSGSTTSRPRRDVRLAAAVLSLAAPRQRLRRHRLLRRRPALRDARRLLGLRARGGRARHPRRSSTS